MIGGTLFSGIGAPEVAAPEIDWRWCAEIDPFACAVLAERFPAVPNLGDVTRIDPDAPNCEPVDIVVFGSPCQSFSVAGKRLGLDDERGNLAFVALGLVGRIRPRWVVFENVPGLLSSGVGRDFGAFLGALAKFRYGFAYRILDAQYAGVPQRRRRVFVVGCLGDWRAAAAVLFERDGLCWDPPPRRQAGQGITGALAERTTAGGGLGTDFEISGGIVSVTPLLEVGARTGPSSNDDPRAGIGIGTPGDPMFALQRGKQHGIAFGGNRTSGPRDVATAVRAHPSMHGDFESETFIGSARASGCAGANGAGIGKAGDPAMTLDTSGSLAIAFEKRFVRNGRGAPDSVVPPLKAQSGQTGKGDAAPLVVMPNKVVPPLVARSSRGGSQPLSPGFNTDGHMIGDPPRRLTPRECERLQGLPDDWTAITYRGKPAADGPRYRAIGNSMAAPVVRWILTRVRALAG